MKLSAILSYDGVGYDCDLKGDSDLGPVHLCIKEMSKVFPKTDFQPNVNYRLTVTKDKRVGAKRVKLTLEGLFPKWSMGSGSFEVFPYMTDGTVRKLVKLFFGESLMGEVWVTCKKI